MTSEPSASAPPPPWGAFLIELDELIECDLELHCLGGFVMTTLYGVPRVTHDIDFIELIPQSYSASLQVIAGPGSKLARKHKVFLQQVGVAQYPENYEQRLLEMYPVFFRRLHLRAFEVHDLALAKLARGNPIDREDFRFLADTGKLNPELLRERYFNELRPYLIGRLEWHDQTLQLWLDEFFPRSKR